MIIVQDLNVLLQNQQILDSVSCLLMAGRITLFIGKSGAGKTTLLKSIAGIQSITSGTILINGKTLDSLNNKQRAEEVGYVFQDFNLFPHMTVMQNCVDPMIVHGIEQEEAEKRALEILQELGMKTFLEKYPSELSGGQQQRSAIARALCLKPNVLLFDEPTASLDPYNTAILITIIKRLAGQGLTIGVSSQDMNFINKIFDRLYLLENGRIKEFCDGRTSIDQCSEIKKFLGSF